MVLTRREITQNIARDSHAENSTPSVKASLEREGLFIKTIEEEICLRILPDKEYWDYLLLKTVMKEPKLFSGS